MKLKRVTRNMAVNGIYKNKIISYKKLLNKPIIKTREETIEKIVNDSSSIARFGDGEIKIALNKGDVGFQSRSSNLIKRLREIIVAEEENLLIGIPPYYFDDINIYVDEARKWFEHIRIQHSLGVYKLLKNKEHTVYYNTNISRFYIDVKDKSNAKDYIKKIKKIWENRDILMVEGDKTRSGVGNDLYDNSKSLRRILAPSENAYSKYNEILDAIKKEAKKEDLIMIALGPTATVLAYDLYKLGYQAIDIGHLDIEYEWMLKGVIWKENVDNKYVNETEQRIVGDSNDKKYLSEIVCKVM